MRRHQKRAILLLAFYADGPAQERDRPAQGTSRSAASGWDWELGTSSSPVWCTSLANEHHRHAVSQPLPSSTPHSADSGARLLPLSETSSTRVIFPSLVFDTGRYPGFGGCKAIWLCFNRHAADTP